jgi:hypothetical protein
MKKALVLLVGLMSVMACAVQDVQAASVATIDGKKWRTSCNHNSLAKVGGQVMCTYRDRTNSTRGSCQQQASLVR